MILHKKFGIAFPANISRLQGNLSLGRLSIIV